MSSPAIRVGVRARARSRVRDLNSEPGQGRSHKEACVCPMIGHGVGGECGVDALGLSTGPVAAPLECDGWFLYRHTGAS